MSFVGRALLLLLLIPSVASASELGFSFMPVPGDVSMVFLGNIFGVVDGVLAGSGSQIVGEMFAIFNSAVLAIGGVVLVYTLLVSTINTAHEGQLLGQKWSSIWVPIRSVVGIGMVLPKASGYCLMQIFVMWIVVQGVGAADKIWNAALGYMNRGGAIIIQETTSARSNNSEGGKITTTAAMSMLASQVCMKTIETKLRMWRQMMTAKGNTTCIDVKDKANPYYDICNNPVPDFISTIDMTNPTLQVGSDGGTYYYVDLPSLNKNEAENPQYSQLTAACGRAFWMPTTVNTTGLSGSEASSAAQTRNLAVHQMFQGLLPVAYAIVDNAAGFNNNVNCLGGTDCAFRTPYDGETGLGRALPANYAYTCTSSASTCPCSPRNGDASAGCTAWGLTGDNDAPLLSGKEIQDGVAAYNGLMSATLRHNALSSGKSAGVTAYYTQFIREAESRGWLMAGAYFFRLAVLNSYYAEKTLNNDDGAFNDSSSGFGITTSVAPKTNLGSIAWGPDTVKDGTQVFDMSQVSDYISCSSKDNRITYCFTDDGSTECRDPVTCLKGLQSITSIIKGTLSSTKAPKAEDSSPVYGSNANVVYGYLQNANALFIPGQTTKLNAGLDNQEENVQFNPRQSVPRLSGMSFSGGKWGIAGSVSTLVFNGIIVPLWNMILQIIMPLIVEAFSALMTPIFSTLANVFNEALQVMRVEGVNPIIALANMGTRLIDGIGNFWITFLPFVVVASFFPAGISFIMMIYPMLTCWMGSMLLVGFSTAYYIPFVPFLVFSFAAIGWLIAVIEAMAAAPIVALGLTHPEGHETFGKAEAALMLVLGIFLRPAMMILGFIFGIILSYVGIWVMNQGFNLTVHDVHFMSPITQGDIVPTIRGEGSDATGGIQNWMSHNNSGQLYGFWSKLFLFYFTVLTYTSLYVAIVQKSFQLIYYLPDKALRWLSGGQPDQIGEQTARSAQAVKGQADQAGGQASGGMAKTQGNIVKAGAGAGKGQPQSQGKKSDGKTDSGEGGGGGGAVEGEAAAGA